MVMLDLELGKSSLLIGKNCRSNEKRAAKYLAEIGQTESRSMHVYLMYVISVYCLCHNGLHI